MNQPMGKQIFDQADRFFRDAFTPTNVQTLGEQGIAASKEFVAKSAAVAQDSAKVIAEIADTAWSSTKILNEKAAQNVTTRVETVFAAAHGIARAKSLPEIAKLQSELFQKLAAQTIEQTKEFVDLSTRATQHVLEKVHAAATKSFKPDP